MKQLLVILLMVGVSLSGMAQKDEATKQILDAMSAKYQAMSAFQANFSNILENKTENISEEYQGQIKVKGEKYHLIVGDQEVFNNGETMWTYFKDENEVTIDNYYPEDGDVSPTNIYNAYKSGFKYATLEETTVGSRKFTIIELQPEKPDGPNGQFIKIKISIDSEDKTINWWKIYDRTGNVYTYNIKGFNPNAQVTDADFEFNESKYPGVEVVDLR